MILDILAKYLMVILWLSYGYSVVRYAELMLIAYWHPRPSIRGGMEGEGGGWDGGCRLSRPRACNGRKGRAIKLP